LNEEQRSLEPNKLLKRDSLAAINKLHKICYDQKEQEHTKWGFLDHFEPNQHKPTFPRAMAGTGFRISCDISPMKPHQRLTCLQSLFDQVISFAREGNTQIPFPNSVRSLEMEKSSLQIQHAAERVLLRIEVIS
jgi:hypothetical protein